MTRQQRIVAAGVTGTLAVAVIVLWAVNKRARARREPSWLDPQQPEQGVAAPLTAAQSWAANRARPMTACCTGQTAGMRTRRDYPATLVDAPYSLIRGRTSIDLEADGRA